MLWRRPVPRGAVEKVRPRLGTASTTATAAVPTWCDQINAPFSPFLRAKYS
jgi:hypothetical protein